MSTWKKELRRHIEAVEKDPSLVDNPISTSLDYKPYVVLEIQCRPWWRS